jgi:hypothetical protein
MEMEQRIGSVLQCLAGDDADDEPIPFAALARELYAVERFFESNGFLSVAKEVAHVERALEERAAPDEALRAAPTVAAAEAPAALGRAGVAADEGDDPPSPSRWAVPRPLAAVLILFVAAVAVCIAILVNRDRIVNHGSETADLAPTVLPTPTAPAPTPTPQPRRNPTGPAPGAVLAEAIGQARLALADDDIEAAMDHLSRAAVIDADHGTVLSTAGQIIDRLVANADRAADAGLWDLAELTLARADRVATRFGLDATAIERAARRHARMDRFRVVAPADSGALTAAAGSRVTIHFKNGSTRESMIKGVAGGQLLLDEDTEVRGGAVFYVDEIPLTEIDYLQVWEE